MQIKRKHAEPINLSRVGDGLLLEVPFAAVLTKREVAALLNKLNLIFDKMKWK